MTTSQDIKGQLYVAAQPSTSDLIAAREIILDGLADGTSLHANDFVQRVLAPSGIDAHGNEQIQVTRGSDGSRTTIDPNHPSLMRVRARAAVLEVLAELNANGVVVMVQGDSYNEVTDSVPVHEVYGGGSSTGNTSFPSRVPVFGHEGRWRLLRPEAHHRHQLARENLVDGLDDVLGPRGIEVLREAVACFHAGRFLAAADLLAAASEAAWFVVGAAAHGHDGKLDDLVARGESAADVIHRTDQVIRQQKALASQTLNDVRAQAAHLRDIRNYGLHPVGAADADREDAFTEPGCAVLFMSARRYFTHLDNARLALLDSAPTSST
ncbi:hypothetical protein ACFWGN_20970 [Oerskovia sp. NPDC060338]|uniref:hypothetical protein n=1 Tax=Oerskovia sp. NPDC060338 TaxID=3347100 RepID=UPI0036595322